MLNVLITDGEARSALAATRSLAQHGLMVHVTTSTKQSLASASKYCHKSHIVTNPVTSSSTYAKEILDIAAQHNISIILPMTEQTIYSLNPYRNQIPQDIILACATPEQLSILSDKKNLFQLAEKLQISCPTTFYLESCKDLSDTISRIQHYPVVIKPSLSRIKIGDTFISTSVTYANTREELETEYAQNPALLYPSMVQEKITGAGTGLFTLYDKDHHLTLFSHQRIREKPPSGGVSVVSESIVLDSEMVSAADKLLKEVGWQGVAMIEFKRDLRDGKAKLIEVNGRFWGTLQLAISCGVDFPALYIDYLLGTKSDIPLETYKLHHRMKWFLGTLDHFLIQLKSQNSAKNKIQSLWDFMKIFQKNTSFDVLRMNDLAPFLHELKLYCKDIIGCNHD